MIKKNISKIFLAFALAIFLSLDLDLALAQNREQLQLELKALEEEMAKQKAVIDQKKKEGKSLERDISILDTKIKKTETEIKATDKNILNLTYNIKEKEDTLYTLSRKINKEREYIANTLKKINTDKQENFVLTILGEETLSDSVDKMNNLDNLKSSLQTSITSIKNNKKVVEEVKEDLEVNKEREESLKSKKVTLKKEIVEDKNEKHEILTVTKGQEKIYQKTLADTEKKANEIRSKIFSFQDGTSVKFGDLYTFAKAASVASGIRVEFILAILEQESALGQNVGQCYVADNAGALKHISTGASRGSMKPDSLQPFLDITSALGKDKFKTRVSCALSYGYGGAMGISQFMPRTWIGFAAQIKAATGAPYADPWNSSHAIMGTGYLLKENGASSQAYGDERNAACRYYSGRSCSSSSVAAKYGDQVMSRIKGIQNKIDILKNN